MESKFFFRLRLRPSRCEVLKLYSRESCERFLRLQTNDNLYTPSRFLPQRPHCSYFSASVFSFSKSFFA